MYKFTKLADKEIHVCYHESIKQNLVELAYQTCFSVMALKKNNSFDFLNHY